MLAMRLYRVWPRQLNEFNDRCGRPVTGELLQPSFLARKIHFLPRKIQMIVRKLNFHARKFNFLRRKTNFLTRKIDFHARKSKMNARKMEKNTRKLNFLEMYSIGPFEHLVLEAVAAVGARAYGWDFEVAGHPARAW